MSEVSELPVGTKFRVEADHKVAAAFFGWDTSQDHYVRLEGNDVLFKGVNLLTGVWGFEHYHHISDFEEEGLEINVLEIGQQLPNE